MDLTARALKNKAAPKTITMVDLYCGGGGTTTGAKRALRSRGYRVRVLAAVNHWPIAIETHTKNHPDARHFCLDVATVRPIEAVPAGRLDLLIAAPTCTHYSRARGGKPTSDQQRMDPWHIIPWLTELRVTRLLVENVPEFVEWGPVSPATGRPLLSRKGLYFRHWLDTIRGLGFQADWRILNAADYGDATTRHRFFLIARSDRRPLHWPEPSHAQGGQVDALYGSSRTPWRAAREIIDWDFRGTSIFSRKRPLSPKTLARIYAGAVKFRWPEPFLVILRQHMDARSVDEPVPALTANGTHVGLVQPILVVNRNHNVPKSIEDPIPPILTGNHLALVEPFVATLAHGNTVTEKNPDARRCRSIHEPLQTIHAGGGKFGIVEPYILNRHGDRRKGGTRAHGVDAPLPTATAGGAGYLVEPLVLPQHGGGAARSVDAPLPTITADGAEALIAPYYGHGSGTTCSSVQDPLPTVSTRDRFGMVLPVTHHDNGDRARDIKEPLPTVTGAHRGELAFITAGFGERDGQQARVRPVEAPAFTVCAQGHIGLVEAREYDILFRMLQPHELAAAMGFDTNETPYAFCGTKTDVIRQIGNAVPVNLAAALVGALMEDRS